MADAQPAAPYTVLVAQPERAPAIGAEPRATWRAETCGRTYAPLLVILTLAAFLRLWGLNAQPIMYFDSGLYLAEGRFLASAADRAASGVFSPAPGTSANPLVRAAQATENGTVGHPPDIAKPGHAVLLAISMLVLGPTAFAGTLVSALAGIATVGVTYAIGARGWNRRVGLLAALLLAVSGQDLTYSREALVESDAMFFAALAGLVYLGGILRPGGGSVRRVLLAGLLFGVAFTSNNRLSYVPAMLAATELSVWSVLGGWRAPGPIARRSVALAGGFILPPALIEVAYLLARLIGRLAGTPTTWLDYVEQMVNFTRMNPPDRFRVDELATYFTDLALMDGFIPLLLLVVGVVAALRMRGRANQLLLGSVLVPLALFSVYSTGEVRMRHFSLALPWVMLAAAIGAEWIARQASRTAPRWVVHRWLGMAIVGVSVVLALPRAWDLANPADGYPALIGYLQQAGFQQVAATNGPALGFYLGEQHVNAHDRDSFVGTLGDVRALSPHYPVIVADMQAYLFEGAMQDRFDALQPEFSAPNGNSAWYLADLLEHDGITWGGWTDLFRRHDQYLASATRLRLYIVQQVISP